MGNNRILTYNLKAFIAHETKIELKLIKYLILISYNNELSIDEEVVNFKITNLGITQLPEIKDVDILYCDYRNFNN